MVDEEKINWTKRKLYYQVIEEMTVYKRTSYQLSAIKEVDSVLSRLPKYSEQVRNLPLDIRFITSISGALRIVIKMRAAERCACKYFVDNWNLYAQQCKIGIYYQTA
mgnify:FL=1